MSTIKQVPDAYDNDPTAPFNNDDDLLDDVDLDDIDEFLD